MKRIGILTLPFQPNYGFMLQAFALQKVLGEKGDSVKLLDRAWNQKNKPSILYKLKRFVYYKYFCREVYRFYNGLDKTSILRSSQEVWNESRQMDALVVGSDQVWSVKNTRGANLNYFFDFVPEDENIKRYSYAASFGKDKIEMTAGEKAEITRLLRLFSIISVREESGLDILKNEFSNNGVCDLDPTLLLDVKEYEKLISSEKNNFSNKVVTYILDPTKQKTKKISEFAKNRGLKVHNLYNRKFLPYYSVEHWLSAIANADFVIVDSFHGMVFSILFEKPFYVFMNKQRGATRFLSLLGKLGLEDRLIYNIEDLSSNPTAINYAEVAKRLKRERNKSNQTISRILEDE